MPVDARAPPLLAAAASKIDESAAFQGGSTIATYFAVTRQVGSSETLGVTADYTRLVISGRFGLITQ